MKARWVLLAVVCLAACGGKTSADGADAGPVETDAGPVETSPTFCSTLDESECEATDVCRALEGWTVPEACAVLVDEPAGDPLFAACVSVDILCEPTFTWAAPPTDPTEAWLFPSCTPDGWGEPEGPVCVPECSFTECDICCPSEDHVCDSDGHCCLPECIDKECGDDGCGGTCGECINDCNIDWDTGCFGEPIPDPSLCDLESGICAVICCPSCCNKECGDDGCGGSCGQCKGEQAVCVQGTCICEPHCDGKDCGDDGCGGECGTCSDEEQCVNSLCGPPWGGTWITVPGGLYVMGCTAGDDSCDDEELPPHQVMVSSFEMLQTEVTEEQYESVTGEAASCGVGWPGGPNTPATCVTWFEAGAFCEAVGGRLPTEAEWEYAARGGTTTQYYCGDDPACLNEIAWYVGNSGGLKQDVMWKDPNDYGLYDMLGNVWEWTEDWYHESYDGAPQVGFPAWESLLGTQRVTRGGDFAGGQGGCKVYRRSPGDPTDDSVWNAGFRCARTPSN